MAFSDPIVGTEVLIRNQIQSENFSIDPVAGVTGWQIRKDGTATFNNLVVGGPGYSVGSAGDAVFNSITLTAPLGTTGIILHGDDIDPELYNNKAKGIVCLSTLTTSGVTYDGTNPLLVGRIIIPSFDATRQYKVCWRGRINVGSSIPSFVNISIKSAWDADTTSASSELTQTQLGGRSSSATDSGIEIQHPFQNTSPPGTDMHLGVYLTASVSGSSLDSAGSPRMWVEDIGPVVTYQSWNQTGGGNTPTTYTKTYGAQWSESYQSDGTSRGSLDNGDCYQGYFSSTNGNQFSLIGFPYSTIASDLTGATISKVEVYLDNTHWYNNSGGMAVIGYHNYASAPSPATYPSGTDNKQQSSFTYGQAKWVTIPNSVGTAFQNGTAKGILLGKGQSSGGTLSNSTTYYGYFVGANKTGEPQLRITYSK